MATLVWFSGCETGGPVAGAGIEFSVFSNGGGGSPSVQTSVKRSGSYGLLTPHDALARIRHNYASNATTYIRCYFRPTANPNNPVVIIANMNSNASTARGFHVWLNTNGTVGWAFNLGEAGPVSSGSDTVLLNDWNFLQVKLVRDAAVGGMEIYLNDVLQVSSFATSTTTGTSLTTSQTFFGNDVFQPGTDQSGIDIYWDDCAFGFGGYIGAGQSVAVQGKAGAPTYNAWTKNGGATAAECWSETPWSNGKNCSSNVSGDIQSMLVNDTALNSAIGASDTINGAIVLAVGKESSATAPALKILRRSGGSDTLSANLFTTTTDTMRPNPVDSESLSVFVDTLANLGALEIGCQWNSSAQTVTIEDMWLLVDFTPAAPPPAPTGGWLITEVGRYVSTPTNQFDGTILHAQRTEAQAAAEAGPPYPWFKTELQRRMLDYFISIQ